MKRTRSGERISRACWTAFLRLMSAARRLGSSVTSRVTKGLRLRWHHAVGCRGGYSVEMAGREGREKSGLAWAPYQGIAAHLPIDRSVTGARPSVRAADAAAPDWFLLGGPSVSRRSPSARACRPEQGA